MNEHTKTILIDFAVVVVAVLVAFQINSHLNGIKILPPTKTTE